MDIKTKKGRIIFKLTRDFNYLTALRISKLSVDHDLVEIRLNRSKIVDSEALISLYNMVKDGKKVILHKPPNVIFEAIEILGLDYLLESGDVRINKR